MVVVWWLVVSIEVVMMGSGSGVWCGAVQAEGHVGMSVTLGGLWVWIMDYGSGMQAAPWQAG